MSGRLDLDGAERAFAASTDGTVGIEEEFAVLDPGTLDLVPRFEELRDNASDDELLTGSIAGELGQAGEANADRLEILTSDMVAANCLKMAKLNFYQCMAVAGPQYEDLFCVGQHGLMDTASCMISAVDDTSGAPPVAIRTADAQGDNELTERQAIERGYAH